MVDIPGIVISALPFGVAAVGLAVLRWPAALAGAVSLATAILGALLWPRLEATGVPEALLGAKVPVLILQPVVENAVKYGVAKSRKPVTVRISAHEEAGRLHIKVKDDGEWQIGADEEGGSTGVGLRNVCDRLTARYGQRAGCLRVRWIVERGAREALARGHAIPGLAQRES